MSRDAGPGAGTFVAQFEEELHRCWHAVEVAAVDRGGAHAVRRVQLVSRFGEICRARSTPMAPMALPLFPAGVPLPSWATALVVLAAQAARTRHSGPSGGAGRHSAHAPTRRRGDHRLGCYEPQREPFRTGFSAASRTRRGSAVRVALPLMGWRLRPAVDLPTALDIALLVMDREPHNGERAAVRWFGRWALESREATLAGLLEATIAMSALAQKPER